MKDRRTKIAFALGNLLFIVLALNRLCAAIVLPGRRSAIASRAHYYDDIEMLQLKDNIDAGDRMLTSVDSLALNEQAPAMQTAVDLAGFNEYFFATTQSEIVRFGWRLFIRQFSSADKRCFFLQPLLVPSRPARSTLRCREALFARMFSSASSTFPGLVSLRIH
jgi:hypothetical protein